MTRSARNDAERQDWVNNDEGLYHAARSYRGGVRAFVRAHRAEIDEVIDNVTQNRRPPHYLAYGGRR